MADRAYLERLSRELTDAGKLVEAGWVSLRIAAISLDAPKIQLEEMRVAFFAGAQHLFGSLMSILEEGDQPTANDISRMELIHNELQIFVAEYERKHGTGGKAQ